MTEMTVIPEGERGVARVFALDVPPEHARFLKDDPAALADILGVEELDGEHAEVFQASDLGELGLAGYLSDGAGIPAGELERHRAALDALDGWVLVLFSRAFGGRAARLTPAGVVRPVAALAAEPTDWSAKPMTPVDSARPGTGAATGRTVPRAARSRARMTGAVIVALVLALVVIAVVALSR